MSNKLLSAYPGKPVKRNITATRNDDFPYKIEGFNADGTPYDFTGHTFKMQVKEKREDGEEAVIDITNDDFTITQNSRGTSAGVNNVVSILHDKANMDVEPGDYVYDIEMTDADGITQTIQKEIDYFRVEQDVSQ